jgi:hypothetical protein
MVHLCGAIRCCPLILCAGVECRRRSIHDDVGRNGSILPNDAEACRPSVFGD